MTKFITGVRVPEVARHQLPGMYDAIKTRVWSLAPECLDDLFLTRHGYEPGTLDLAVGEDREDLREHLFNTACCVLREEFGVRFTSRGDQFVLVAAHGDDTSLYDDVVMLEASGVLFAQPTQGHAPG